MITVVLANVKFRKVQRKKKKKSSEKSVKLPKVTLPVNETFV